MATNKNFVVKNGLEVGGDIVVTGSITQAGMSMPASDGSSGQYLQTDGNGNLTWSTVVTTVTLSDGSATDATNSGETITFVGGTGISTTVTDNTVTIDRVNEYTDADAIAAVQSAPHLTIDGGTLYVDTDNGYVGIGDTSPAYMLDVGGTTGGGSIAVNGNEVITSLGLFTGSVADSAMTVGGSLVGPLSNLKVQYGTSYNGTPVQGSFFFDSLNQKLMVYTGSGFVDAVPAGTGSSGGTVTDANTTFRKYVYITGSDTNAISGLDVNGETLSYVTDGTENIEVYVNGIKQVEGTNYDYIATTGTSVTFTYNIPTGSSVDIQVYEFLSNDAYYVKSEVYTKTETNTQIATGLSSYLPLVGGTLTGTLNGINAAFTGNLSVSSTNGSAAVFSSATDNQIELNGNNTQWAGIKWVDPNGEDFIWYNGSSSTFAIGGGGSTTAGKKLHVDGGTTIGVSADTVTPPTDGLYIQGALRLGGMQIRTANDDGSLEHVSFLSGSSAAGIKTGGILSADTYSFASPTGGNIVAQNSIAIGRSSPRYSSVNLDIEGGDVMLIGGQTRLHFYRFGSGNAYTYHHIKTNYSWNGSMGSQMFSVRFTGHEYGASIPIDTGLVWYSYGGSGSTVSIGYNGTHACTCYQSSDGKVVMRIQFGSGYYAAWSLSQYTTNQGLFALDILGVSPSNSATVY